MGGAFGPYIDRKTNMLKINLSIPNVKKKRKHKTKKKTKLPVSHLHNCKTHLILFWL